MVRRWPTSSSVWGVLQTTAPAHLDPHSLPPLEGHFLCHPSQHQLHPQGPATGPRATLVRVPSCPSLLFPAGVLPMLPLVGASSRSLMARWSCWLGPPWGSLGEDWETTFPLWGLQLSTRGMSTLRGCILPYLCTCRWAAYGSKCVYCMPNCGHSRLYRYIAVIILESR